jgi:ubiquitin-like modifier-activating enzyme ATG7
MLQFVPWQSAVDVGFWQKLAHRKLDEFRLSEAEQLIFGHYMPCNHAQVSC